MKQCQSCHVEKPLDLFRHRTDPKTQKIYHSRKCRACQSARVHAWRSNNRDKVSKYNKTAKAKNPAHHAHKAIQNHYKRKFGITLEERAEMLAAQGGRCLICKTDKPTRRGWCIDHDHVSGAIRGVLCAPCNSFIGMAKESTAVLENAITYIEACDVVRDNYSQ